MPRWRALPDELDPQVREFASQLRRLVDRSGLSIAALADRTGYSKTSWERYLNGRLLAPKGAIVALAEVTGTNPVHLTTMWELAERAWSRSEMRHDMTMEAIRISQARAALSEFGAPPANAKSSTKAAKAGRKSGSATATPGVAGPAGVAPTVPPVPAQPTAPEVRDSAVRDSAVRDAPVRDGESSGANSWGLAGYRGPAPTGAVRPSGTPGAVPGASGMPSPYGEPPRGPLPGDGSSGGGNGKRRLTMFLAGVVGVLVVIAAVFFLTDGGGKKNEDAVQSPSPSASTDPDLPAGVKCSGDSCTGKDAETMGCSGDLVTTAKTATVGTSVVEVRYSEACGAAWGRVTQATQGDEVVVTVGKAKQTGTITVAGDTIAYTPMVAVKDAGEAKACVTLAAGQEGCTQ
ncbi:XRE family transcriptional regulator [Streptomyces sp. AC550_RSS872]|uniref:helix-turn-helix domain-containing protein n=1 Tax=Streptomyces sp. AC550_RSS872 TaxID=2823689 RepID=UPI001C26D2F0|nr:XRE family transcriptional regulator [Streptomyces sp. AC550_RSS872]